MAARNYIYLLTGEKEMKILIVDDHDNVRKLLGEWLGEAFPQHSFIEMETAPEALDYCSREIPLAVIMDIDMPGMNGIDATTKLKSMWPDIKVVILTIHENGAYKEASLKAGANAFVVKRKLYDDLVPVLSDLFHCPGSAL